MKTYPRDNTEVEDKLVAFLGTCSFSVFALIPVNTMSSLVVISSTLDYHICSMSTSYFHVTYCNMQTCCSAVYTPPTPTYPPPKRQQYLTTESSLHK